MRTEVRLPANISEKDFQRVVVGLAEEHGYLAYHTHDSRRSKQGFPDLVLVGTGRRAGRLIFAELKTTKGKVSPEQEAWLHFLALAHPEAYLWRPEDAWQIVLILRRLP